MKRVTVTIQVEGRPAARIAVFVPEGDVDDVECAIAAQLDDFERAPVEFQKGDRVLVTVRPLGLHDASAEIVEVGVGSRGTAHETPIYRVRLENEGTFVTQRRSVTVTIENLKPALPRMVDEG